MKPHKWAKEIKAWADGAEIEYAVANSLNYEWHPLDSVNRFEHRNTNFRIKPQPKEDIIKMTCCFCGQVIPYNTYHACTTEHNVKPQPKDLKEKIERIAAKVLSEGFSTQPVEPQYLYAYFDYKKLAINWSISGGNTGQGDYIGKIKLEVDDEKI